MNALSEVRSLPWDHWTQQVRGILNLELRRHLLGRRALLVYILASAPVFLCALTVIAPIPREAYLEMGGVEVVFAIIYRTFILRFLIFLGCVVVFMNLFRGDLMEKTLHYYFLAPVKRPVLVAGKYLAGVVVTSVIFGTATLLSNLFLVVGSARGLQDYFLGDGLGHLAAYLGVTIFACMGYGAVFLMIGLFVRNWIVPAALVLGWEYINFLLPPVLKKFSVIYYVESLCPVGIPEGPVAILAEPAPAWLSIPGLLLLTLAILTVASWKISRMEILYGEE